MASEAMVDLAAEVFDHLDADADEEAVEALAGIGEEFAADIVAAAEEHAEEAGRDTVTGEDVHEAALH